MSKFWLIGKVRLSWVGVGIGVGILGCVVDGGMRIVGGRHW